MNLRVGFLGAGGIAARHAAALAQVDGLELVAAASRRLEGAQGFTAKFGGVAYPHFERMLGEAALDLLVVTLPPGAHAGEVEKAAAAGVNLLVEKPIALDLGRARAMVDATADVVAACGFMYRFGAAVERWEAMDTGPAAHFSGSFHCNALHAPWWRSRKMSGGQMVEQLIHIVDLVRNAMGRPSTVYARATNFGHREVPGYDTEDMSAIVFGYHDGRIAALNASNLAIPGRWMKGWQIIAERATGMFADFNTAELVITAPDVLSEKVEADVDPFVAQLTDLRDAINNRRAPRVPLADGLATLELVLAARRSADEAREVAL